MQTPKTQKELLQIIEEQEIQIRGLKQAMMRMEQRVRQLAVIAERTQGSQLRLNEQMRTVQLHLRK